MYHISYLLKFFDLREYFAHLANSHSGPQEDERKPPYLMITALSAAYTHNGKVNG